MDEINGRGETPIIVRQVKRLNNIVEQDHRATQRATQTHARLQIISSRQKRSGQHRTHTYDSQRTVRDGRLQRGVSCRAVLCIGRKNPFSLRNWHSSPPRSRSSRVPCDTTTTRTPVFISCVQQLTNDQLSALKACSKKANRSNQDKYPNNAQVARSKINIKLKNQPQKKL